MKNIENDLLNKGYIVKNVSKKNLNDLKKLNYYLFDCAKSLLPKKKITEKNPQVFFNNFAKYISLHNLNDYRVKLMQMINSNSLFKDKLYSVSNDILDYVVGNELAVQKRINLSIQLPNDNTSLLPVHADTWSGDSPFEIVVWLPFVDCFNTKSMYILPPKENNKFLNDFSKYQSLNAEEIFQAIKDDLDWINIKYGQVMIFNQSLPHGNVTNLENETRWSINCRFKSLFSPYGDKKLGEFFEPLNLKIMSKIGMNYKYPKIK